MAILRTSVKKILQSPSTMSIFAKAKTRRSKLERARELLMTHSEIANNKRTNAETTNGVLLSSIHLVKHCCTKLFFVDVPTESVGDTVLRFRDVRSDFV